MENGKLRFYTGCQKIERPFRRENGKVQNGGDREYRANLSKSMAMEIAFLLKDQGIDANTTDTLPDWLEKARKILILKRGTMEMAREITMKKGDWQS